MTLTVIVSDCMFIVAVVYQLLPFLIWSRSLENGDVSLLTSDVISTAPDRETNNCAPASMPSPCKVGTLRRCPKKKSLLLITAFDLTHSRVTFEVIDEASNKAYTLLVDSHACHGFSYCKKETQGNKV